MHKVRTPWPTATRAGYVVAYEECRRKWGLSARRFCSVAEIPYPTFARWWAESPRRQQREFVREVFERMVVEGPELASITPKPLYSPLFVLDRRERFGGDFCSMAPRAGFEPTT